MAHGETTSDSCIERWSKAEASERANAQLFLTELADLLGVPRPSNSCGASYAEHARCRVVRGLRAASSARLLLFWRYASVVPKHPPGN